MKIKYLFLIATLAVAFSSCKKDEDNNGTPSTDNKTLIMSGAWTYESIIVSDGTDEADFMDLLDDCEKDNQIAFLSNDVYQIKTGPVKCDPSETDPVDAGVWTLSADQKTLTIDGDASTILTCTSSKLVIRQTIVDPSTQETTTITANLKK